MRIVKTSYGEYQEGGIYHHYKNKYYRLQSVSKLHDSTDIYLINYNLCDANGVYISIRENIGTEKEIIIHQPFSTHETRWSDEVEVNGVKRKRFELIK